MCLLANPRKRPKYFDYKHKRAADAETTEGYPRMAFGLLSQDKLTPFGELLDT